MLSMHRNIFVKKISIVDDALPVNPFSFNRENKKHTLAFYIAIAFLVFVVLNAVAIGLLFFR
jgi:type IV secretory pathway component VirB8